MELYKLAGSKLREALQLDPLLPWLLDVRKKEEAAKHNQFNVGHDGLPTSPPGTRACMSAVCVVCGVCRVVFE